MIDAEQHFRNFSTAAANNQAPILEKLVDLLPGPALVLEIGSGSGQHAHCFASALPFVTWQPTDHGDYLPGLEANMADFAPDNVNPPLHLDLSEASWPIADADLLYAANVVHIMPAALLKQLFDGARRVLNTGGCLVLYGPFKYAGQFTTDSNARFDQWLKANNPLSGIRDIETLLDLAESKDFSLEADHALPANNQLLVFRKRG